MEWGLVQGLLPRLTVAAPASYHCWRLQAPTIRPTQMPTAAPSLGPTQVGHLCLLGLGTTTGLFDMRNG